MRNIYNTNWKNCLTLHRLSAFLVWEKQDWLKTEFQTQVLILIHFITKKRNRHASGPVHTNNIRFRYIIFFHVGSPKESIFLTTIYALYFSHHYTYIQGICQSAKYILELYICTRIWLNRLLIFIEKSSPLPGFEPDLPSRCSTNWAIQAWIFINLHKLFWACV